MTWEVSLPVLGKRVIFCQTCHLSNCGRWNKFAAMEKQQHKLCRFLLIQKILKRISVMDTYGTKKGLARAYAVRSSISIFPDLMLASLTVLLG